MKRIALILVLSALAITTATAADSTAVNVSRDDHRARMEQAIEAGNYDAWKAESDAWGSKGQASQKVTRENFGTLVKLHEAVKAGRTDEATALRQELGMSQGKGGMHQGKNGMAGCKGKCAKQGNGMGQGQGKGKGQGGKGGMGGQGCNRNK
ncbi:MAG: hypothetical protein RL173_1942 [Fibrobacterota bacterium]|jgi:hypothetical protein